MEHYFQTFFKRGEMASLNIDMIDKVADEIRKMSPEVVRALNFTEEGMFPSVNDPAALSLIFAVTMQDFGFWIGDERGYVKPLYGEVDGRVLKGSDLLWTLSMKTYRERGAYFFNSHNLAQLEFYDFNEWLPGKYGFQDIVTRYNLAVGYGKYSLGENIDLETSLDLINRSTNPYRSFLKYTSHIPGYNTDRLMKKNIYLAMILVNRPEHFLHVDPEDLKDPLIDYHLERVGARLGIVDIDEEEYSLLAARFWMPQAMHDGLRSKFFEAYKMIIEKSGKEMSEIDFLFWSSRRYCPEMTVPDCPKCVLTGVCRKKIQLFQPVFRTTNY